MGILWHIIVRHSQMQSTNIPPMIRRCIPFYNPTNNGSITFLERRLSSTLITSLYSSCKCRENYKMTTIKSGPHICNISTSTSYIRKVAPTRFPISLVDVQSLHLPWWSTHVAMIPLGGPNFILVIPSLLLPIWQSEKAPQLQIIISKMAFYATWVTSTFLQVSVWS